MIYVAFHDKELLKYQELHPELNLILYDKINHPCHAEEIAEEMNKTTKNIILYDSVVIDYINVENIFFVTDEYECVSFGEKFKDMLEYSYPGEIIINHSDEKE